MITEECLSRNLELPPTPGAVGAPGTAAWESRGEGREGRGSTMWGEREGGWVGGGTPSCAWGDGCTNSTASNNIPLGRTLTAPRGSKPIRFPNFLSGNLTLTSPPPAVSQILPALFAHSHVVGLSAALPYPSCCCFQYFHISRIWFHKSFFEHLNGYQAVLASQSASSPKPKPI